MKKILFFTIFFLFCIGTVHAESKCTKPDTEEWEYQETLVKSSFDPGQSFTTETEKTVCCELGGGQTKQYYCDVYKKKDTNDDSEEGNDYQNLEQEVCNPGKQENLDKNWQFVGCKMFYHGVDYFASSPEKEVPGVEKIVCGVEAGSNAGVGQKWYKCDIYEWAGEEQEAPENANANGPYVSACNPDNDWVYVYSQMFIDYDLSGTNENIKTCCMEGSGQTSGKYTCDTYVRNGYQDNIILPPPDQDDQHGFSPNEVCKGENCDINLNNFCGEPTVASVLRFIGLIIFIAKILVPAIIIIMGFVNLFKIMTSGKEDEAKKQVRNIIRNIVIGILIFLLPSLIKMIFDMADNIIEPETPSDFSNCVNCLTDPNSCIIKESD